MNAPNTNQLALLTHSRLSSARSCQRLHHIKYELGYHPLVTIGTRRFGTLVHEGLRVWWEAKKVNLGQADWLRCALSAMFELANGCDAFELAKAEAMLEAYHLRWKDEPYEVIAVEVEFTATLVNPLTGAASRTWQLGGKLDVIVRDMRDGRTLTVEHKTSAEDITPGSGYWRRLRMDGQVSVYFVGAEALGHPADACLYDVLGKPTQKPMKATPVELRKYTKPTKTEPSRLYKDQRESDETPAEYKARIAESIAEAPERYLARGEVVRLEQEMTDAIVDVWQLGQQIRESELAGRAPRNPGACVQYGRECDFFDVCSGAASLDDTARFERSKNIHPELQLATPTSSKEESNQ